MQYKIFLNLIRKVKGIFLIFLLCQSQDEDELRRRVVVNREESHEDDLDLSSIAQSAFETAEELVHKVWEEVSSWKVQPFSKLPKWLQDNDFLHHWHR